MHIQQKDITDEQILDFLQGQGGTEQGFRLLVEKYQERLYWQVRRMVYDHDDANDVLQNCLVKVYRNIGKFERKAKLYTWLYRIVTNEAITFLNKKKQRRSDSLDEGEQPLAERLEADSYFDGDAAQIQLQEAIATLPEKQKLVFNLRYFDEMSYADMSESLGTSEGALKASFHHAVKKVEAFLRRTVDG